MTDARYVIRGIRIPKSAKRMTEAKRVFAALSLEIEVYVAIFDEGYATADKLVSHKAVVGCDIR